MQAVGLLDTNILIDVFHNYAPAISWMQQNSELALAIPSLVRMEMVVGARNKVEQSKIIKLLSPYPILYPSEQDAQWAMEQFEIYYLSHQIEIIDCFIAAMGVRLGLPIYTRNRSDLSIFNGVRIHAPY